MPTNNKIHMTAATQRAKRRAYYANMPQQKKLNMLQKLRDSRKKKKTNDAASPSNVLPNIPDNMVNTLRNTVATNISTSQAISSVNSGTFETCKLYNDFIAINIMSNAIYLFNLSPF